MHACRYRRSPRPLSGMPTAILAILHVVGEHHAEAVCAAALSHVAAAATAQLPIKLVILHNRPGHFEKPLRALIASHVSNVVFCSYTALLSGEARRSLFGEDSITSSVTMKNGPTQDAAAHCDGSAPSPKVNGGVPVASGAAFSVQNSHVLSKSARINEGVSGFIGGPGVDSTGWGISQHQLSDDDALKCSLWQVAVGCAHSTQACLLITQNQQDI